MLEKRKRS